MKNEILCFSDLCPEDSFLPQETVYRISALKFMYLCKKGQIFSKLPEAILVKQDGKDILANAHSNGTYFFVPEKEQVVQIIANDYSA